MAWNRKAKRVPTLYICTCAWQQQLKRAWSRQIIQTHRQRGQGKVQLRYKYKQREREQATQHVSKGEEWGRPHKWKKEKTQWTDLSRERRTINKWKQGRTCCVHVCACNNILLDKWVNWFHPVKKHTSCIYTHTHTCTHTHSNIVKYLFEYILKSNLFLWWQSWIFSSHYSNLHCHKLCFHLPVFIQILISHQKWVMDFHYISV